MNWENIAVIIGALGGLELIKYFVGLVINRRNNRRKDDAEADKAETEADKEESARLITELDHQQKTIENLLELNNSLSARLSKLNETVDKHIDRNRELSDRLYKSETELNRANERIADLTQKLGEALRLADYYEVWRCERHDCQDPRGPRPPRDKLKGLKFEPPKRGVQ